ncbi:MAG: hypothetical protein LQ351_007735 [Letrouitia transgressa]|nr:MAG: hypothetical protein LQ351_007735 [Letrouitia transgressa]
MLRGWLREKKGELNASTHSLDSLAEPQNSSERLADAEITASVEYRKAQRDAHTYRSPIYPPGSEFSLCHAESQLMAAVVGVLNESLTESIKGFYKLRKAFITLDGILQAEAKYVKGLPRSSVNSRRSVDSLRSNRSARSLKGPIGTRENETDTLFKQAVTANASQEAANGVDRDRSSEANVSQEDDEDDEFYDADEVHENTSDKDLYQGHLEMNGVPKNETGLSNDDARIYDSENLPIPRSPPQHHELLEQDPDSDVFSNSIDVFIHSGANLCFGLLLLMISMIPPAFSRLLFIIGFHGDRDRGLRLLWQASKFHNINGAMAGLCLLGYYHAVVGFADILPEATGSGEDQSVQGYPKERCEILLADMRSRHPKSQLWLLEEARMESMNRRLQTAVSLLEKSSGTKSPLKQVEALKMFEKSLTAMYIHDYALCSKSFIECVSLNNWSHALYYYIAGAAQVELYRNYKLTDTLKAKGHAEKATEYMTMAPKHAGKKKFMARQLPFDVFVTRKVSKWESRAKEWNCDLVDAVGVSPLEEMIIFWNGFKRMNTEQLQTSLERLAWSESPGNPNWKREGRDEKAILAVLKAATLRELRRYDEAESILSVEVLNVEKSELKGALRDNWTGPCAHYEMGVICWLRRKEAQGSTNNVLGKSEVDWVKKCEEWIEKVAKWESYDLDARIGLKVATAQDTLKKYWQGVR